jgi:hypothetical protein
MVDVSQTKDRQRSPHCPTISLQDAVRKITSFHKADRGNPASRASLAAHWNLSPKSSVLQQAIASLKRYGLLENAPGSTKLLRLTPRAVDIIMLDDDDPKRIAALKAAALNPNIFRTLWDLWGASMPSDRTAQHHMVTELGFTVSAAADAIRNFRTTISFANLESCDKITSDSSVDFEVDDDDENDSEPNVKVGDLVQWEPQGIVQFAQPRRVQGLSPNADFAFVEGSATGLPIREIKVVQATAETSVSGVGAAAPLINPHYRPLANMATTTFPLSHGTVRLEWPTSITPKDCKHLKALLAIALEKIEEDARDSE